MAPTQSILSSGLCKVSPLTIQHNITLTSKNLGSPQLAYCGGQVSQGRLLQKDEHN